MSHRDDSKFNSHNGDKKTQVIYFAKPTKKHESTDRQNISNKKKVLRN